MSNTRKYRHKREDFQSRHAAYIHNKGKTSFIPFSKFDPEAVQLGSDWYHAGHTLEEADIKLQKNVSFVNGFTSAVTKDTVNKKLYDEGILYCKKGIQLCDAPDNLINKPYFIQGYNDELNRTDDKKNSRR